MVQRKGKSIKSLEFRKFPVLERSIRKVTSNDKWNFLLGQLFFSNCNRIPVHVGHILAVKVERRIFGDLNCSDSNNFSFLEFGHEGRGNFALIGLFVDCCFFHNFIIIDRLLRGLIGLIFLIILLIGIVLCILII